MLKNNKISRKHHYIPQFHLKGFLDDVSGSFFVFDKKNGKFWETNTKDIFFEKDRNIIIFPNGDKSDFLENLYTDIEKVALPVFKKIQEQRSTAKISYYDKLYLSVGITALYWRLPSSDVLSDKIRETQGFDNVHFNLSKKDGSQVNEEKIKKLLSSEPMRRTYRLLLPFEVYYDQNFPLLVYNWQVLFNDPGYFMIGDNPIIMRNKLTGVGILDEFVVPLSKECLLINNKIIPTEKLPGHFFIQMALVIFHQADRFVCCHNKQFLEKIISSYNDIYIKFDKTEEIKKEFFDMIDKSNNQEK